MSIDSVKVSHHDRNRLMTLKRRTGIDNWNTLCRWAFCISLSVNEKPRDLEEEEDSTGQSFDEDENAGTKSSASEDASSGNKILDLMTWATFGGEQADIYLALLKARCKQEAIEPTDKDLAHQLKLHLHRGIGYLLGGKEQVKTLVGLISKAVPEPADK